MRPLNAATDRAVLFGIFAADDPPMRALRVRKATRSAVRQRSFQSTQDSPSRKHYIKMSHMRHLNVLRKF